MKKLLTLFLTLLLITTNAYAEWTSFAEFEDGQHHFYDKSTVKRNGDKTRVWTYWNFAPAEIKAKSLKMSSVRTLEEFDCVNETRKSLASHNYTKNNLKGDMNDMTLSDPTIVYVAPNSVESSLMKLVCKK
jgi:hypothetical protein